MEIQFTTKNPKPRKKFNTEEERRENARLYKKSEKYLSKQRERSREKYRNDPNHRRKVRSDKLKRIFGITIDEYETLLISQRGVCAICLKPENVKQQGKIRDLAVDHNHTTGKIRALLCNKCNIGIGVFLEDVLLLERAKDYLIAHNGH